MNSPPYCYGGHGVQRYGRGELALVFVDCADALGHLAELVIVVLIQRGVANAVWVPLVRKDDTESIHRKTQVRLPAEQRQIDDLLLRRPESNHARRRNIQAAPDVATLQPEADVFVLDVANQPPDHLFERKFEVLALNFLVGVGAGSVFVHSDFFLLCRIVNELCNELVQS